MLLPHSLCIILSLLNMALLDNLSRMVNPPLSRGILLCARYKRILIFVH